MTMTLQGIDNLGNRYYAQSRRLLSIIGLCPYQKTSRRLPSVCFIIIILAIHIPLQIYVLFITELKLGPIIDILQTFLPSLCFASCYCNLLYNLSTVKKMFDRIRYDWVGLANEQELNVMQQYAKQSRLWTLSIACLCYLYAVFLMFPSIINFLLSFRGLTNHTKLILPFPKEYSIENRARLYPIFSLQFIIVSVVSTLGVLNYSILVSSLQHARALFTITITKIDRAFKRNSYSSCNMRTFKSMDKEHAWIISVITSYNDCIKFVDLIKSVFGKSYLIETLIALFCIIIDYLYVSNILIILVWNTVNFEKIDIFEIITTTKIMNEALRDFVYIGATLLVIYVYCYLGQKLIDHNTAVFVTCCQVPFYTLSLKTQKVLLLLIIKTMRPCNFSVTRMIVTSHELFGNLMRTSLSYALIFHNVLGQ